MIAHGKTKKLCRNPRIDLKIRDYENGLSPQGKTMAEIESEAAEAASEN